MWHVIYSLFMACCMFMLAACGLMIAVAMWRRSNQQICAECKEELDK